MEIEDKTVSCLICQSNMITERGVYGTISFPPPPNRLTGICVCDVEMYTPLYRTGIQVRSSSASSSDQLIATRLTCIRVASGGGLSGDGWRLSWDVAHVWYEWDCGMDGANRRRKLVLRPVFVSHSHCARIRC